MKRTSDMMLTRTAEETLAMMDQFRDLSPEEAEKLYKASFARFDTSGDGNLQKDEVSGNRHSALSPAARASFSRQLSPMYAIA